MTSVEQIITESGIAASKELYSQVQVINENKIFSTELNTYFQKVDLLNSGLNYHLIAVFGSQSTGKSTLLNALFGTEFDVMNESRRQQTTKGIWMARAKQDRILILDVEGSDGRERGEDQDFERKAALFALATSEVLIVNIWEHQVGLYQGANMGLLKTVFEVNLNLFHKNPNKSLLLFVIRDHIGVTPLEDLAATLTADLTKIWESLAKPEGLNESKITDFFALQFTALPHKILQPKQFDEAIGKLEYRFEDKSDSNYVFDPKYHRNVPADGWSIYASNVWEQIELNKDLDLPTQQILVARFRCEEISGQAWDKLDNELKPVEAITGIVESLGETLGSARSQSLEVYDSQASRYAQDVYLSKRKDLLSKIDARLLQLFNAQLTILHKVAIQKFVSDVKSALAQPKYNFLGSLLTSKLLTIETFTAAAIASRVEGTDFSFSSELKGLEDDIESEIQRLRLAEAKKLTTKIVRKLSSDLDDQLSGIFKSPSSDLWDRVLEAFNNSLLRSLSNFKVGSEDDKPHYDFGLGGNETEALAEILHVKLEAWKVFYQRIKEFSKTDNVLVRLREYFEEKFKYDEKGVPRLWSPSDNIDEIYSDALQATLEILPVLAVARLENGEKLYPESLITQTFENEEDIEIEKFPIFLTDGQILQVQSNFKKIADSLYIDAKRSTIQSIRQVPLYFYLLLLVLGWNEFMAVLRNPLYFTMLAVIAGFSYAAYHLNLLGPLATMSNAAFDQAVLIGKEKLREVLDVPHHSHTHQAYNVTSTNATQPPGTIKSDIELETLDEGGKESSTTKSPGGF
ncbi:RHD3/Sey1 [Lipomyces japonicus]|uniref:RHD3/Sey1 n=1 Tax=Lipomyces japonicus TaxID=56871 RepID=UPI0034CDAE1A